MLEGFEFNQLAINNGTIKRLVTMNITIIIKKTYETKNLLKRW